MIFNVPQFIDIEDKIVGPLTAKQLGWLAMGFVILLILYGFLDRSAFIISAVLVAVIFGALAFYKPYNQPLIIFIIFSILFIIRPKMYVWHRTSEKIQKISPKNQETTLVKTRKKIDTQKIAEISRLVDMKKYSNH